MVALQQSWLTQYHPDSKSRLQRDAAINSCTIGLLGVGASLVNDGFDVLLRILLAIPLVKGAQ